MAKSTVPKKPKAASSPYVFSLLEVPPATIPDGVAARKGNHAAWPILDGVSIAQVEIPTTKWRSVHYHVNTAELAMVLEGVGEMGIVTPDNRVLIAPVGPGDCIYFPLGWPHWLRNTGKNLLRANFNYGHDQPVTFEIANIVAHIDSRELQVASGGRTGRAQTE